MADIFSGWNAVQNARPMAPPSSLPQIATLGNLVDVLEQRRAARAAAERQQQMDALAMRKQEERDAYYRRKLDLQDERDRGKERISWAKHNQAGFDAAMKGALQPGGPGELMLIDENTGIPYRVKPRFEPHKTPAQATPSSSSPLPAGKPMVVPASLESTNVVAQALDRNPDADSADELGMGPKLSPEEAQAVEAKRQSMLVPWPEGRPLDLDDDVPEEIGLPSDSPEAQDIEARRSLLLQGDPGGNIDLENPPPPVDYQEPQEGDLPPAGLMSPEESKSRLDELGVPPLPPKGEQPSFQALQDALDSRGSNVPQAEAAQPAAEFKRGKWVYDIRGQPFEIDLEQARQARLEEVKDKVARIDAALADPNTLGLRMEDVMDMRRERAMLLGDLPANDRSALLAQGGRRDLQAQKDASADARLDKTLASREKIAEDRNAALLKKAQMTQHRIAARASAKASSSGLNWREVRATEMGINSFLGKTNWTKLIGVGKQRLDLALENATAEGPNAATQHMEALMNFFGYIRGGVPAKNETDEWKFLTGTFRNWMDSFGSTMGLDNLFSRYMASGNDKEYTQAELDTVSKMPPQARRSLIQAIQKSQSMISKFATKQLEGLATKYRSADPRVQQYVQDNIDGYALVMEVNPRKILQGAQSPQATPAGGQPAQGKMSVADAVQKLLEAKGAK